MVYDIEFIRAVDGKAEALALEVISLVGDHLKAVIQRAEELYQKLETVPRPDGYRIREAADGDILHEFREAQHATAC